MAFEHIDQRMIKAFAVGEHGGHELGGVMELEPGGLIGLDAVGGAVRFAKGVAAETGDQVPDLGDLGLGAAAPARAVGELGLDLGDDVGLLLAQRAPQDVGPPGRQAGEGLADLEDVLFIDHQPVGAAQARLRATDADSAPG